jgi:Na+/H+-dicarboxylate symporter
MQKTKSVRKKKGFLSLNTFLLIALGLGVCTGLCNITWLSSIADGVSQIFINLLKLVSLPMIFLSVVSTISGMGGFAEVRTLGRRTLVYAAGTTFLAGLVALGLFLVIQPAHAPTPEAIAAVGDGVSAGYWALVLQIFPDNIVKVFLEYNVVALMLIAICLGLAILTLKDDQKQTLHSLFSSLFGALLKLTHWLLYIMPLGVWAFVTILMRDLLVENPDHLRSFILYLAVVVGANLIQATVVLPLMLKMKGISPIKLFRAMLPACTVGFFTRSSNAALPVTLDAIQTNAGVSKRVSNFAIPLCATINMNACCAFILTTVLYVSMSHGMTYSVLDLFLWVGVATVAAMGNAGVAMGCYFMSSALLATMNMPLGLLGMILPVYTFIDMLETAVNIWSDAAITCVIDKDEKRAAIPADDPIAITE